MQDTHWAPHQVSHPSASAPLPLPETAPEAEKPAPATAPTDAPRLASALKAQLLGFSGLVALLSFTIWVLWMGNQQLQIARHQAGALLQSATQQLAKSTVDKARSTQQLLVAAAPLLTAPDAELGSASSQLLLQTLQASSPQLLRLFAVNTQGQIAGGSDSSPSNNVASSAWFAESLRAAEGSTSIHSGHSSQNPDLLYFTQPLYVQGSVAGVLVAETQIGLQAIAPQANAAGANTAAGPIELMVFDSTGKAVASSAPNTSLQQTQLPSSINTFQATVASLETWPHKEGKQLTSVAQIQDGDLLQGWRFAARQADSAITAPLQRLGLIGLISALALAAVAAAVVWMLSRRWTRDLDALQETARRIDAGERNVPVPHLHSCREVQQMSNAFISMTRHLLSARETMEQEVQMRTKELYDANRELDRHASTDQLTGLFNRRGFDAQVQFAMALARRSGRPLCLMQLDIDNFRKVNDQFGHEMGDLVLKSVANQLRTRLRDSDVIARFGGEEFVVLLPDTPPEAAQTIAREILRGVETHQWPLVGSLTLSAGVTALRPTLQNGTEDSDHALLRRSDEALHVAKNAGRNQVFYTP